MALVGISEAAKLLGVNKSTVSRQVAKGIIPNHAEPGRPPLVDPDEARLARTQNIDTSKSATPGLGLRQELFSAAPVSGQSEMPLADDEDDADEDKAAGSDDTVDREKLSYNTARTASVAVQAKRSQAEYLREIGQLVATADVERAAQDHARSLRDRLLALPNQVAGLLASESDERKCAALLRAALKECLNAAISEMEVNPTGLNVDE